MLHCDNCEKFYKRDIEKIREITNPEGLKEILELVEVDKELIDQFMKYYTFQISIIINNLDNFPLYY